MTENKAKSILSKKINKIDHNMDVDEALEIAKRALDEIQEYKEIGSIEECKEALKRQNKIKATKRWIEESGVEFFSCRDRDKTFLSDNQYVVIKDCCPVCGKILEAYQNFCGNCGQAIKQDIREGYFYEYINLQSAY